MRPRSGACRKTLTARSTAALQGSADVRVARAAGRSSSLAPASTGKVQHLQIQRTSNFTSIPLIEADMDEITNGADLAFVHLSDIHFRQGMTGDVHDADVEIRNELERDLRRIRSRVQKLDGIVISGDVAYGGQADEYAFARNWIDSVREQLGCPAAGVMVIPGNHDVDRDMVPDGGDAQQLHEEIRAAGTMEIRNAVVANILRHPTNSRCLLRSYQRLQLIR